MKRKPSPCLKVYFPSVLANITDLGGFLDTGQPLTPVWGTAFLVRIDQALNNRPRSPHPLNLVKFMPYSCHSTSTGRGGTLVHLVIRKHRLSENPLTLTVSSWRTHHSGGKRSGGCAPSLCHVPRAKETWPCPPAEEARKQGTTTFQKERGEDGFGSTVSRGFLPSPPHSTQTWWVFTSVALSLPTKDMGS